MHARTIDTGATIAELRAFGPPQVVELDDFTGTNTVVLGADKFWTVVRTVCFDLATSPQPQNRWPRLTWNADEQAAFAEMIVPVAIPAGQSAKVTFAVGVQPFQAAGIFTIVAPMPELVLLPGATLTLDVLNADAGDSATNVRAYLQRYQLITLDELIED